MRFPDDPADMCPNAVLAEVAAILATGYLRQRQIAAGVTSFTEKPLDVPGRPRPPLSEGLTAREEEVTA